MDVLLSFRLRSALFFLLLNAHAPRLFKILDVALTRSNLRQKVLVFVESNEATIAMTRMLRQLSWPALAYDTSATALEHEYVRRDFLSSQDVNCVLVLVLTDAALTLNDGLGGWWPVFVACFEFARVFIVALALTIS